MNSTLPTSPASPPRPRSLSTPPPLPSSSAPSAVRFAPFFDASCVRTLGAETETVLPVVGVFFGKGILRRTVMIKMKGRYARIFFSPAAGEDERKGSLQLTPFDSHLIKSRMRRSPSKREIDQTEICL